MFMAASMVFEGADPPPVAAENSCVQAELDAPLDEVHALRTFASVFSREIGDFPVGGNDTPGALPLVVLTRFIAVAAASAMPLLLVDVAPIWAPAAKN
jgi:hypothetical protein